MVSYKLDKYDKYFVAFILVILVIFNIGQCFAVEIETVDPVYQSNIAISGSNKLIENSSTGGTYFVSLENGYNYHIEVNSSVTGIEIRTGFSQDITVGSDVYSFSYVSLPYTTDINGSLSDYLYFDFGPNGASEPISFTVTRQKNNDMSLAVDNLVNNVGPQQLWSVFESGIDFIGVVVLVAFGLFLIVLLIKKLSKGKSDF